MVWTLLFYIIIILELFSGMDQHDAQEFLNYVLNTISDELKQGIKQGGSNLNEDNSDNKPCRSFVQDLFEGTLLNETKCLICETITSRQVF